MEKIKEYKGIIILTLIVLGGAFYWYEWRPTQVREKCNNSAFGESMKTDIQDTAQRMNLKDKFYTDCLRYNGLEK